MALVDSSLTDKTNALLDTFSSRKFKAHELKEAVPLRSINHYNSQHTENLTRYTQDATSVTGMTGQSDSNLVMDPEDKERTVEDLKGYKDFVSTLKFAYLESNIKLQFVAHITDKDSPRIISLEENDQLEKNRLKSKAILQEKKRRAAELEGLIRAEAEALDSRLQRAESDAVKAAEILRECETMEAEIALLKNKRSAAQRVTIDEAIILQDDQLNKMAQIGPKTALATEKIAAAKSSIKKHKSAYEKLEAQKKEMNREQADRELKGTRDERAEEGCRWITNATALYSSLLGIRSAYALGSPPTEMIIEYERAEGDSRTLSIKFGANGQMVGAELIHSNIDIQDIVETFLPSQDIPSLIGEIRCRIIR